MSEKMFIVLRVINNSYVVRAWFDWGYINSLNALSLHCRDSTLFDFVCRATLRVEKIPTGIATGFFVNLFFVCHFASCLCDRNYVTVVIVSSGDVFKLRLSSLRAARYRST